MQNVKRLVYLDEASWERIHHSLSELLPLHANGEITGIMCSHGYSTDWRKVKENEELLKSSKETEEPPLSFHQRRRR